MAYSVESSGVPKNLTRNVARWGRVTINKKTRCHRQICCDREVAISRAVGFEDAQSKRWRALNAYALMAALGAIHSSVDASRSAAYDGIALLWGIGLPAHGRAATTAWAVLALLEDGGPRLGTIDSETQ